MSNEQTAKERFGSVLPPLNERGSTKGNINTGKPTVPRNQVPPPPPPKPAGNQ